MSNNIQKQEAEVEVLGDVTRIFLESMTSLDEKKLSELNPNFWYDDYTKEEFVEEYLKLFISFKEKGISKLKGEKNKCLFCFPDSPTYNFYDSETGDFLVRYVIHQENNEEFKIQECKNRILSSLDEDGLPF